MRQETIVRTILKFDELDENQKSKVIENMRDINTDYDWYEHVYDDAKTILGMLGFSNIEITYSGFWSQGDGASFTASFDVPRTKKELKERQAKVREYAPNIKLGLFSDMRFDKDEKDAGTLEVFRICPHYAHYNTISSDNNDLKEFARDFSKWIYKKLESEYEYLTSNECITETIECNEYEFYADTLKIA